MRGIHRPDASRMIGMSERFDQEQEHVRVKIQLDQVVRHSLIELGDLREINERIHSIGERFAKLTPEETSTSCERKGGESDRGRDSRPHSGGSM